MQVARGEESVFLHIVTGLDWAVGPRHPGTQNGRPCRKREPKRPSERSEVVVSASRAMLRMQDARQLLALTTYIVLCLLKLLLYFQASRMSGPRVAGVDHESHSFEGS